MIILSYQFHYLLIILFTCYIQINHSFLSFKTSCIIYNQHQHIQSSINSLYATTNDKSRSSNSYSNVLNWYEIDDCSVLIPSQERIPKAIIHFIGGFLAGSSIQIGYSSILSELCSNGYLVIATPIPPIELDHMKVSNLASQLFLTCYSNSIKPILGNAADDVPIIGLSHSLGGKLTALIHSNLLLRKVLPKRYANIYLAFNNYGIQDSIQTSSMQANKAASPEIKKIVETFQSSNIQNFVQNVIKNDVFKNSDSSSTSTNTISSVANDFMNSFNKLNIESKSSNNNNNPMQTITDLSNYLKSNTKDFSKDKFSFEFNPSPIETWQLIQKSYNVNKNYVIKFTNDDIDQSIELSEWLLKRGCDVKIITIPGNHLTPNAIIIPSTIASSFFSNNNDNNNNVVNNIINDNVSKETQLKLQEEQKIALDFIKELIKQLNIISNKAWDEIITNNKQKYNLPRNSYYNNNSNNNNNEDQQNESKKWDSDNY